VAKDSSRITAGELQKIVESRGQKTLKKIVKQPLHHHMLFGRISRKILLTHPKTISSIFSYQTGLALQMGLASMVR
jgi:predicted permease